VKSPRAERDDSDLELRDITTEVESSRSIQFSQKPTSLRSIQTADRVSDPIDQMAVLYGQEGAWVIVR
jgi:hypothetical protein